MPSSALRELLKCRLPGGHEEISGNPSPRALSLTGEGEGGGKEGRKGGGEV